MSGRAARVPLFRSAADPGEAERAPGVGCVGVQLAVTAQRLGPRASLSPAHSHTLVLIAPDQRVKNKGEQGKDAEFSSPVGEVPKHCITSRSGRLC